MSKVSSSCRDKAGGSRRRLAGLLAAVAVASIAGSIQAVDLEVGPGKAFATIQDGINAAVPILDRVVVFTATYNEQVVWSR